MNEELNTIPAEQVELVPQPEPEVEAGAEKQPAEDEVIAYVQTENA